MRVQGTLAIGALTIALVFVMASAPRAAFSAGGEMVQYVQTVKTLLPDGSVSSTRMSTVTESAQRERTDDEFGTYVVECDRQRTIRWTARDKSYVVETFEEIARQYAQVEAAVRKEGESEFFAAVHDTPDEKTTTIDGMTAHHVVETVNALPNSSLGTSVSDVWYATDIDPFACPVFEVMGPHGELVTTSSDKSGFSEVGMVFSNPKVPAGSIVLREATRSGIGANFVTEVTAIRSLPYDPAYFEPPTDFAQATPEPLPSFPHR